MGCINEALNTKGQGLRTESIWFKSLERSI